MPRKKSQAMKSIFWSPRCPYCRARLGVYSKRTFLDRDGELVDVTFEWQLKRAAFQECKACGKQWPVWAREERISEVDTASIVETHRTEEHIGDEIRRVENTSAATIQRIVRATRE